MRAKCIIVDWYNNKMEIRGRYLQNWQLIEKKNLGLASLASNTNIKVHFFIRQYSALCKTIYGV